MTVSGDRSRQVLTLAVVGMGFYIRLLRKQQRTRDAIDPSPFVRNKWKGPPA